MGGLTGDVVPLVGRTDELETVVAMLQRVAAGGHGGVIIEGEAGIGKSRLLDEALAHRSVEGATVLRGTAHQLERNRPFGLLIDALNLSSSERPEGALIAELLGDEQPRASEAVTVLPSGPTVQYRAVEAILALIEKVATPGALVLVLEDLHWADPSTLLAVDTMRRRLEDLPLGLLITRRLTPTSPDLERVITGLESGSCQRVALGLLDDTESERLLTTVAGAPPATDLCALLRLTGGNPLYIIELIRAWLEQGRLHLSAGCAHVDAGSLPPSLTKILLDRLADLSSQTFDMLRVASVLGASFDFSHLELLTESSPVDLMAPVQEALRAGVLNEVGLRFAFSHELVREALYADLPGPLKASLHSRAGRLLGEINAEAVLVAEHLALGASPGDQQAIQRLHEAARITVSQSPESAVHLLKRGLELAAFDDALRDPLHIDLVVANLWSGRIVEAEALSRELLSDHGGVYDRSVLHFCLLHALLAQGKTLEAFGEIERLAADPADAGRATPQLQAWTAFAHILSNGLEAGAILAAAARETAIASDDDVALCISLCGLALLATYGGRLGDSIALAEAAVERAAASSTPMASQFNCGLFLATALIESDRFPDARAAILRGRNLSQEVGARWNLPLYCWTSVLACFAAGQWDDATAEAETGFQLADEVESHFGEIGVHCMLALIAFHRNDVPRSRAALIRAENDLAAGPQHRSEWVLWLRALEAESLGDDATAYATLAEAWRRCIELGLAWDLPVFGPDLVRLALRQRDEDTARGVAHEVGLVAERIGSPSAKGAALRSLGLTDGDPEVLGAAVAVLRTSPRPLDRALAAEDMAVALAHRGHERDAIRMFDEASRDFEVLDARRDLARVGASLRALGVRRGQRGARSGRPTTGWESLTPTECAVAGLIAEGLANREVAERLYIGHRTVETHLRHMFSKLGLRSRRQLREMVAQGRIVRES